jgi:hypothetical protein
MGTDDQLPFELTAHARFMLTERGIDPAWVARALARPDRVVEDPSDPALRHALAAIPERDGRFLRVVYNRTTDPWRVVTAFFDRRERKGS